MRLPQHLPSAIAIAWLIATPAFAADAPLLPSLPPLVTKAAPVPDIDYFMPHPIASWQAEFGARFWYGNAKTGKSLYDLPTASSALLSRLTYSGLVTDSGELFGRISSTYGIFIKGYIGGGAVTRGHLQDEDFPPTIEPYSSTISGQHGGFLTYASVDVGYDVIRGGDFRVGAFVGYHYFDEGVNALGCTQTAPNPDVCQPSVSETIKVISQTNTWQSVRLGLDGAVQLAERFTLSADAAWLPYVHLYGADTHWLRLGIDPGDFASPTAENGTGHNGYQLEAVLSYQVTHYASVGVGGRYWHMQSNGHALENFVDGGSFLLPEDWKTDIYGVFVQGSLKFDPYPFGLH